MPFPASDSITAKRSSGARAILQECSSQSAGPTGRHSGAACVASGLPAESKTGNWWAASVRAAAVPPLGHQRNGPGQPLVAEPKTLAVIHEDLQRRGLAIAEDEDRADERVVSKRPGRPGPSRRFPCENRPVRRPPGSSSAA